MYDIQSSQCDVLGRVVVVVGVHIDLHRIFSQINMMSWRGGEEGVCGAENQNGVEKSSKWEWERVAGS